MLWGSICSQLEEISTHQCNRMWATAAWWIQNKVPWFVESVCYSGFFPLSENWWLYIAPGSECERKRCVCTHPICELETDTSRVTRLRYKTGKIMNECACLFLESASQSVCSIQQNITTACPVAWDRQRKGLAASSLLWFLSEVWIMVQRAGLTTSLHNSQISHLHCLRQWSVRDVPSAKKLDVIEGKIISPGLELTQTGNMPSPLHAPHLLHITDYQANMAPKSQHAIAGTRGM